ncbi:MAG TPA: hypothetical protein VNV43_14200 [Candidatus Acidoferrales bacterium]|nr:hypothetical protein [Candidatus Acidoferrales bacterium]
MNLRFLVPRSSRREEALTNSRLDRTVLLDAQPVGKSAEQNRFNASTFQ